RCVRDSSCHERFKANRRQPHPRAPAQERGERQEVEHLDMIQSANLDELGAALSAAQGEFEAVSKTANNPFFKSKYAALPDVVKAATPILAGHGLAVWQGSDTDDTGELLWTV